MIKILKYGEVKNEEIFARTELAFIYCTAVTSPAISRNYNRLCLTAGRTELTCI